MGYFFNTNLYFKTPLSSFWLQRLKKDKSLCSTLMVDQKYKFIHLKEKSRHSLHFILYHWKGHFFKTLEILAMLTVADIFNDIVNDKTWPNYQIAPTYQS